MRSRSRLLLGGLVSAAALLAVGTGAGQANRAPGAEPGFLTAAAANDRCDPQTERQFPECRRLHFAYGPIVVTPGNNQALITPVTVDKPAYDGYATRVKPDLVHSDGSVPPVDNVHLHHVVMATLESGGDGLSRFAGAGEEKTISESRPGYGKLVRASDVWVVDYMIHNLTTDFDTVWYTYDVDFIPRAAAEARGIKPIDPLWLDVTKGQSTSHAFYPVFNVLRGYGKWNARDRRHECAYPRERCSTTDPWGKDQPGNGKGWDYTITRDQAGTLIAAAGHLHPGGLRAEISLVRTINGRERVRRIFNSEAKYWDPKGPVSWDMSMTITPPDWKVQVKPGDKLRVNAIYETDKASWYESMGIVVAMVSPRDTSGVDPFQRVPVRRRIHGRLRSVSRYLPLPLTGPVTHGHLAENDNHGGTRPWQLPNKVGPLTKSVNISNFQNLPGDLSRVAQEGIPEVKADQPLTFYNADWPLGVLHSVTTCKPPCTATTGISYPLADDGARLDSLELGVSPTFGPAANTDRFSVVPRRAGLRPGDTYTYFCRIHPFMRGAFKVVQ